MSEGVRHDPDKNNPEKRGSDISAYACDTQLRLAFQLDDNDDLGADTIIFFSGDAIGQGDRLRLWIDYYAP